MRDDRTIVGIAALGVTIAVTHGADPETVHWVRRRRLDAGLFPVIVDIETGAIAYSGPTFFGAVDWS